LRDQAVFVVMDGATAQIVTKGTPAPGTSNRVFTGFGSLAANNAGQVAIIGTLPLVVGSSYSTTPHGIWTNSDAGLRLVASQGGQPPGTPSGARFDILSAPVLNDAGRVAFTASLLRSVDGVDLSNSVGIWAENDQGLQLVARQGSPAPGTLPGTNFGPFFFEMAFNNAGQVAFRADAGGSTDNYGIWAQDRHGELQLIALRGQQINVGDATVPDLRTIRSLALVEGGLNDLGQIAFTALFTDGSDGLFISNAVAAPEPGAWSMSLAGACAAASKIARRLVRRGSHRVH
jgi:hypothetical protein